MFKKHIQKTIEKYVRKYMAKHQPKLILVTGSVGKTSTKLAIATVLSEKYRVRVHEGNHNTHMSVPLGILGIAYPDNIRSLSAWLRVRKAAKQRIKAKVSDCDVIVQELGTDTPGDIAHFGTYIRGDIAVVTAVSPEHMELFKTLDIVAQEELSVSNFSRLTAINRDDIDSHFSQYIQTPNITTYGMGGAAEHRFLIEDRTRQGIVGKVVLPNVGEVPVTLKTISESGVKAAVAGALVGAQLGMSSQEIIQGLSKITPPPGRMNILRGLKDSMIIDDTYNASPLAVEAALKTLYTIEATQRIAIIGDMNELGEASPAEYQKLAMFCHPTQLHYLVTVGPETEKYLAPAARDRGIPTHSFKDSISAGAFVHSILEKNAVVLGKGSQNGIFVEEALKIILHETEEEWQLVRQSPAWLKEKDKQFAKF
jgi:UDP-N-acetylmuramoyl-tripeptide--D-alanyl-D-alanine ligase